VESEAPLPQGALNDEQKEQYRQALRALHADQPCSRCGADFQRFGVLPATSMLNLFRIDEAIHGVQELRAETVAIACLNCGAIYQHLRPVLDAEINRESFVTNSADD
jgi:hypothetical protein